MAKVKNNPKVHDLTMQEQLFINNYVKTGKLKESVIAAGYTTTHPSSFGRRLITKTAVAREIRRRVNKMARDSIMTSQEVMEYFSAVTRGEIKDQFGLDAPLAERTRAAIELAKRTIDIENRERGIADAQVAIKLDWTREE